MKKFICLIALSTALPAYAEKNVDLKPKLGTPGSVLFEDSFDRDSLGDRFAAAKGEWTIDGGELVGVEKVSDKHAAVLTCKQPNTNSIVRFSFKLDGSEGFSFSLNKAGGHLFRVNAGPKSVVIVKDKNKKDPKSKAVALGSSKSQFKPGTWYTMLVEIKGQQVRVETDNGIVVEGKDAELEVKKPNYRFVMRGEGVRFDDFTAWNID